jgi:hypothetical protein
MINKFYIQKEVTENNKIIRKKTDLKSSVVKMFQQEATILKLSKKK